MHAKERGRSSIGMQVYSVHKTEYPSFYIPRASIFPTPQIPHRPVRCEMEEIGSTQSLQAPVWLRLPCFVSAPSRTCGLFSCHRRRTGVWRITYRLFIAWVQKWQTSHPFIFHCPKLVTWSCVCARGLANVGEQMERLTLLPPPQGLSHETVSVWLIRVKVRLWGNRENGSEPSVKRIAVK